MKETIDVLGTPYKIRVRKNTEDKLFYKLNCNGYCNEQLKEIVVGDLSTFEEYKDMTPIMIDVETKSILRHEIVHAFLRESGLCGSSNPSTGGWATNEEMVDWIALQGLKIYKAWEEVEAL